MVNTDRTNAGVRQTLFLNYVTEQLNGHNGLKPRVTRPVPTAEHQPNTVGTPLGYDQKKEKPSIRYAEHDPNAHLI